MQKSLSSKEEDIAGVRIPAVQEEPVKGLCRWCFLPLTYRNRPVEIHRQMEEGLRVIDKCGLPGKLEAWCFKFGYRCMKIVGGDALFNQLRLAAVVLLPCLPFGL